MLIVVSVFAWNDVPSGNEKKEVFQKVGEGITWLNTCLSLTGSLLSITKWNRLAQYLNISF